MANALWITLIGMGLVFIAILLLWGGMALLVRVTTERETSEGAEAVAEQEAPEEARGSEAASAAAADHKRRAAAVAVTVALALHKTTRRDGNSRPVSTASAWQAVNRGSQINQALNIPRKKVVR